MVSDLRDHPQIERFLRNASAEELIEQRNHIQELLTQAVAADGDAERLISRIAYELRFRIPQPI
jgi:hypothetical protein